MKTSTNKTAGILWGIFTASALFCAFTLPFFIVINITDPGSVPPGISLIMVILAIYHASYRLLKLNSEIHVRN